MATLSVQEQMARLEQIKKKIATGRVDEREAKALIAEMGTLISRLTRTRWSPYPWQLPPDKIPTMGTWLMLGGRGTGKTEGGSRYLDDHMQGPPCDTRIKGGHRAAIVAPTLGDAAESCVQGPSGLQTINPAIELKGGTGGVHANWPSGARARLFGAYTNEDVERLRAGGNRCVVWMEEAAAMRFLAPALDHTSMGLRIGRNPHYIMSTTPKPRKELRDLLHNSRTLVTKGTTREAFHLDPEVRAFYFEKYEGTRIGRQELDAEILEDIEGALWTAEMLTATRVFAEPEFEKIVVGVDPGGVRRPGRETGIVVVGRTPDQQIYVIADKSGSYSPGEWGAEVVKAFHAFSANEVVAEKNYGGEMVRNTIVTVPGSEDVKVEPVTSVQGKAIRAEPVVALYERGLAHHVGTFPDLEQQMTEWVPGTDDSPDRLDALVHAATRLAVKPAVVSISNPARARRRDEAITQVVGNVVSARFGA